MGGDDGSTIDSVAGDKPRRYMRGVVMKVRAVKQADAETWERMRQALWPSCEGEHAAEIARYFDGDRRNPAEVLLACEETGRALGFVELSIRPCAESCYSGRVAYLEGWYVETATRRQGVGASLIQAAETWAKEQGCTEIASDTAIDNGASEAAHRALGFNETVRSICFRKDL